MWNNMQKRGEKENKLFIAVYKIVTFFQGASVAQSVKYSTLGFGLGQDYGIQSHVGRWAQWDVC